ATEAALEEYLQISVIQARCLLVSPQFPVNSPRHFVHHRHTIVWNNGASSSPILTSHAFTHFHFPLKAGMAGRSMKQRRR
ncbi:hypothetical protein LINPERHAP2_LOCUS3198, partial [Linum perenne]